METEKELFKTPDIALMIALVATGYEVAGVERLNERRALLCFYKTVELDESINKFWKGEVLLPIQETVSLLRKVKDTLNYGRNVKGKEK